MKKLILVTGLFISILTGYSATYYVATTGNNDAAGTKAAPWGTWQKAFETADAGDTVFFRGGVWYPKVHAYTGTMTTRIQPSSGVGHNGIEGNPICFLNYPGESPVLDCKYLVSTGHYNGGITMINASFIHFRGLTIRNIYQKGTSPDFGDTVSVTGINAYECDNIIFENIILHDIGGRGYYFDSQAYYDYCKYDSTSWINCDVYNCVDTLSNDTPKSPGNMADAWKTIAYKKTFLHWNGCRAWACADDGYDLSLKNGNSLIENSWTFDIGRLAYGNGNGFKFGGVWDSTGNIPLVINNSLAAWCNRKPLGIHNSAAGFEEIDYDAYEPAPYPYFRINARIYNCTSYKNDIGFMANENTHHPYRKTVYRNNISYKNIALNDYGPINVSINKYWYPESNNTWDFNDPAPSSYPWDVTTDSVTITDDDFVATDSTTGYAQLSAARKADGSLPDITFLTLKAGSDLIDAGTQIPVFDSSGIILKYNGAAPDIGAFEYGAPTSIVTDFQNADGIQLLQNSPNPFSQITTIKYIIPNSLGYKQGERPVILKVYTLAGIEVANLVNRPQPAGVYEVIFDASALDSGVYFYCLKAGNYSNSHKLIIMK